MILLGPISLHQFLKAKTLSWLQSGPWDVAGEKGPGAKACEHPLEAGGGKEMDSPLELPEGIQSCQHLDFSPWVLAGLLTSRTVRQYHCVVLAAKFVVIWE